MPASLRPPVWKRMHANPPWLIRTDMVVFWTQSWMPSSMCTNQSINQNVSVEICEWCTCGELRRTNWVVLTHSLRYQTAIAVLNRISRILPFAAPGNSNERSVAVLCKASDRIRCAFDLPPDSSLAVVRYHQLFCECPFHYYAVRLKRVHRIVSAIIMLTLGQSRIHWKCIWNIREGVARFDMICGV